MPITTTRHRCRHVTVGLVAAAAAAGVPSLAGASVPPSESDEAAITIIDEGDAAGRVVLIAPAVPGMVADSTTSYDIEVSMVASGIAFDVGYATTSDAAQTTEVLSVDDDGSYTARQTLTSFDHAVTTGDGTPTSFDELGLGGDSSTDFTPLVDLALVGQFSAAGDLTSLVVDPDVATAATAEQEELVEILADSGFGMDGFGAMLPATPVGEGAVWTVSDADNPAAAVDVPLRLRFTLVSLEGDEYTIQIAIEGDALDYFESQAESDETEASGDLTLTGTMTGNASSALDVQVSLDMIMDMTFAEDDVAVDVDAVIAIEHASTPR